ncbi:MAG: hypothetical protein ABSG84_02580 [Acidobacteriaceae bacterium]
MRNVLILIALVLSPLGAAGGSHEPSLSELPDGTLSGNMYANDAVGLRFQFPDGWVAVADPKGPIELGLRTQDRSVDRCFKMLLSIQAPEPVSGRFRSGGDLMMIDPSCFSDAEFPDSMDKKKVQEFAGKIMKFFSGTPYILPGGANVDANRRKCSDKSYGPCRYGRGSLVTVYLSGDAMIDAYEDPSKKEQVHVNSLLALTAYGDYWVAQALLLDEASRQELKKITVSFKDAP